MDEPQTHEPEMCYMLAIHWDTIGNDTGGIRPCMARFFVNFLPSLNLPYLFLQLSTSNGENINMFPAFKDKCLGLFNNFLMVPKSQQENIERTEFSRKERRDQLN